jgi:hypothetical protein
MHRPASPCRIQKPPEPEPLVIQILIGAKVKFQEGDEGHIKELKQEIQAAVEEHIDRFTGSEYHKQAMWPYLINPDAEITFSDEGSFEYVKGKQEE